MRTLPDCSWQLSWSSQTQSSSPTPKMARRLLQEYRHALLCACLLREHCLVVHARAFCLFLNSVSYFKVSRQASNLCQAYGLAESACQPSYAVLPTITTLGAVEEQRHAFLRAG